MISILRNAIHTYPPLLQDYILLRKLYEPSLPATSIIKADLEFVANNWREVGFDLWEEVRGQHFFTSMVQLKALDDGAAIAREFKDHGAAKYYEQQSKYLTAEMWKYWDSANGHLISTQRIQNNGRSGLNCDLMLGALHGNGQVFPPWSEEVLSSLEKLVKVMSRRYPNTGPPRADGRPNGVGIGRYIEDIYDGVGTSKGNAWFICTASVARVLYSAIVEFTRKQKFTVTSQNLHFFQMVNPGIEQQGEFEVQDHVLFNETVRWMFEYGDGFMEVIRKYVSPDGEQVGNMAEQFDPLMGRQLGARDLTWSYGSFISAVEERYRARQAIWGY